MIVKKITALLIVEEIEPCLKFWTERMSFTKTVEVPEGDRLGFIILQQGNVELMYQSFASVEKDDPGLAKLARRGPTFLYIEVDKLASVMQAMRGAQVFMEERTTFYGAREFGVTDPAGHHLIFAEMAAAPAQ